MGRQAGRQADRHRQTDGKTDRQSVTLRVHLLVAGIGLSLIHI